jgi:AAA family ATPase
MVYVSPPDAESRASIWEIGLRGKAIAADVDYERLAAASEGCSGAEIVGCCRDAAIRCIVEGAEEIGMRHCEEAAGAVERMITGDMIDFYERFRDGREK